MIYLASPYWHTDPAVREARYQAACQVTAALLKAGLAVVSLVVYSPPLVVFDMPADWNCWERVERAYLASCDKVIVLMLPNWQQSTDVQASITLAHKLGKPVQFLGIEIDEALL
jgi:hypothetical protein